ncbi:MAG: LacI family DNA-binding transcriptional regulator [Cellulomonadaceae bacterium]
MERSGFVKMEDIARAAGVSMATASRAINNAPGVAEPTRQRVLRIAEEMSYVISPEASALSRGRTGRVGLISPHLTGWFFSRALEGVDEVLRAEGIDLMVTRLGERAERAAYFEHLPQRRKVDALILLGTSVTLSQRERLRLLGVSIFAAGGKVPEYPFVGIDDRLAARQAVDHLVRLRHRRIAMVDASDPQADNWPTIGRREAYQDALREAGLKAPPEYLVDQRWGVEGGALAAQKLLSLPRPPTAIFAHSDEVAFGVQRAVRRAGLRIPEDLSVIGIDDDPFAEAMDLTTIHQDVFAIGSLTARKAVAAVRGESFERETVVPTWLVPRGSTAPPP